MAALGLQPLHVFAADAVLDIDAAADDHGVQCRGVVQPTVGGDLQAIAGGHRQAVLAQGEPPVQLLARQMVGHAQRLHRGGEGDQGEIVEQQEADRLENLVLLAGRCPLSEPRHGRNPQARQGVRPHFEALL
ncbi:hypothetical protein D3C84_916700 [compost metagenome]